MFKRIVIIAMLIVMSLSCVTTANAAVAPEDSTVQPMFNYTATTVTSIDINNGTAYCLADVIGESCVTKIVVNITLQKQSLFWWSTVDSWEIVFLSDNATVEKSASVGSGTYRVKAVYTVYSGSDYEKITSYSPELSC